MSRVLKNWFQGVLFSFGLALTGSSVCAQQVTTFDLTGVQGPVMGGVYTSPYQATVGGVAGVNVICDDFWDESYLPEDWDTYVTNYSNLSADSSLLKWQGGSYGEGTSQGVQALSQTQAYATAAYLAEELLGLNQNTSAGQIAAGEYSYALWGVFDSSAFGYLSGQSTTDAGYAAQAESYLNAAANYVLSNGLTASNFSNFTIYSYDPPPSQGGTGVLPYGCNGPCPPPPQEFIVMAEPPAPALVAVDVLVLAGIAVIFRRRLARG
jgi:hypothetical protein